MYEVEVVYGCGVCDEAGAGDNYWIRVRQPPHASVAIVLDVVVVVVAVEVISDDRFTVDDIVRVTGIVNVVNVCVCANNVDANCNAVDNSHKDCDGCDGD